ncbi:MAG: B12-binding domain-containing protein [Dermatophilaceae bacterium]
MTSSRPSSDSTDIERSRALYLDAVYAGDRQQAINLAMSLLQQGVSAERVVTDLLARAQEEVGQGWQDARWSVAMEHRASAITESALLAVISAAMRAPGAVQEGIRGRVVIACSEGEWHMLPAQMATEVLRLRGADVSFIGPSVPADELAGFIGDDSPAAVAITCSMPMSLVGAWRSISGLRALGMTVVCGGRGFGPEGRWGLAMGADHWAPDFASGADIMMSALDRPAPAPREPACGEEAVNEVRVLRRDHETLVEGATQAAFLLWPRIRNNDSAMRATREDLAFTLQIVAAATLVEDRDLVTEYIEWFEKVLAARHLPLGFVSSAFDLILDVLPLELPRARAMAQSGRDICTASSLDTEYSPENA